MLSGYMLEKDVMFNLIVLHQISDFRMFKKRAGRSLRVRKDSSEEEDDAPNSNSLHSGIPSAPQTLTAIAKPTFQPPTERPDSGTSAMSFADDDSDDSDICENPDWFVRRKNLASKRANDQAQMKFKKRERNAKKEPTEVSNERKVFDILPKKADDKINVKVGPLRKGLDHVIKSESSFREPSNQQTDVVLNKLGQGVIPNAAEIHAARKRRQFARDTVGADYMPLATKGGIVGSKEMVREDFSSGEEEERMEMVGKRNDRMNQRITIQETIDDHNEAKSGHSDDDNSDNEMSKWEQEQLEKVIGKVSLKNLTEKSSSVLARHQPQYHESHLNPYGNGYETTEVNYASVVSHAYSQKANNDVTLPKLPEVDINSFMETLKTKLQQLQTTHEKTADEMRSIVKQNVEAETEILNAKETLPNLELEFKFFQKLRNYVNDLVDCLNEKILVIEKVEQLIHQCYKRESEYLRERREQELSDETTEMTMLASSNGFLNPANLDDAHNQRILWRCGRRQRRRAFVLQNNHAAETRSQDDVPLNELELYRRTSPDACDGLSSDEELDANFNETLLEEQNRILNEENFLFEDTVEEFRDLEVVMQKLEAWKISYPQSYDNSFVSDNLPKLFSPFVRLEMLHWNPLKNPTLPLSSFTWFRMLCLFGVRSEEVLENLNTFESESVLVCRVIERVIIPKLVYFVENVWKVSSISQSKNLSIIIKDLLQNYPTLTPESKKVQKLVDALMVKIDQSISEDIFIPLYSRSQIESIPAMRVFLHRQYWNGFKVAFAICSFDGVVAKTKLLERFCNGLLNRYLLMALTNLPLDELLMSMLEKLVFILPDSWFPNFDTEIQVAESPQEFAQFIRFLSQITTNLAQKVPRTHLEVNFCGQLLIMLSKMKAFDIVKDFINNYNLNQFQYLLK